MEPLSRRSALTLGGVGAALVLVGGAGLVGDWTRSAGSSTSLPSGKELAQPKLLRSANGLLELTLTAARSAVTIGVIVFERG